MTITFVNDTNLVGEGDRGESSQMTGHHSPILQRSCVQLNEATSAVW